MDLTSWIKRLTIGNVIFETTSPINGKIQVVEDLFGRRLMVGGVTQSGGQVRKIWSTALKNLPSTPTPNLSTLILGLGAGTLAKLASQRYPQAQITGVEVDPKVVEIGKKYFDLGKIPNLKIVISDAANFVSNHTPYPTPYTLVFLDLYLGDRYPSQCETKEFLTSLRKLLAKNGWAIFNRLYYKDHKEKSKLAVDNLKKVFKNISTKKVGGNLLIFCQD